MKTTKILLAGSTAIGLSLAGTAFAQTVPDYEGDWNGGGTYTEGGFAADASPVTTSNGPVVGGLYDSTAVQTGTNSFEDGVVGIQNLDDFYGVNVTGTVVGTYTTEETTVTHVDLNVPANTTTDPSTYVNALDTITTFNVSGSSTTGTPITATTIATVPGSLSGNTVQLTQTNSTIDGNGVSFASYTGTATYNVDPTNGNNNEITGTFNSTPVSETTLDASGLTTTGTVTAPSVLTDSVESTTGSLHLGTTTGASYIDVNEDDVVIHGGDSSTTVTVNNAGVNIANTTAGTGGTVHFTSVVGGADFTIDNTGALSSANAGLNGGAVTVGDDFWVTGEAQIDGDTWLNANLDVDGDSQFDGDVNVSGNLSSSGNTTLSSDTGSTTVIGQTATNATAGDVSLQAGVANKVVLNADATAANNNVTISGGSTVALATNVAVSDAGVSITSTTGGANLLIASDGSISSTNAAVGGGAVNINDGLVVGPTSGAALTGNGISTGTIRINTGSSNKITGLADGTIASGSSDAVTGNQLYATNVRVSALEVGLANTNRRVDKAYQGVAMGFASNAAPLNLANGEGGMSAGVGYFQGEWGGAVRAQYVTDSGVGLGLNVGFSADAVGGGVGASIKF